VNDCLNDIPSYLPLARFRHYTPVLNSEENARSSISLTHFFHTLLARNGLAGAFASPRIALGILPAHRQATSVSQSSVTRYVTQTGNVLSHLPAQLTANNVVAIDYLSYPAELILTQAACLRPRLDLGLLENLLRRMHADPVDVG
jgi:hypothetical protein